MNSTLCTISMRGGSQGVKNKSTDKLCTFKEGKQLVYLINQIRSKSKK